MKKNTRTCLNLWQRYEISKFPSLLFFKNQALHTHIVNILQFSKQVSITSIIFSLYKVLHAKHNFHGISSYFSQIFAATGALVTATFISWRGADTIFTQRSLLNNLQISSPTTYYTYKCICTDKVKRSRREGVWEWKRKIRDYCSTLLHIVVICCEKGKVVQNKAFLFELWRHIKLSSQREKVHVESDYYHKKRPSFQTFVVLLFGFKL